MKALMGLLTLWVFCVLPCFAEENREKATICLNMIVKNESEVITRCLESVLPLIDTWVIVDTGSTDGTQEIIKKFFKDVPGTLYERPWVNFGFNREEALVLAKNKADYVLFIDADDQLIFSKDFKMPPLNKDFYSFSAKVKEHRSFLTNLIKSSVDWHWHGSIHEYIVADRQLEGDVLEGVEYQYLNDGARSKDPSTYVKDLELLKQEIQLNPQNPRNFFYLGKTHLLLNQYEEALIAFQKRVEMQGWDEEVFASKLTIGQIQNILKKDSKVIMGSFTDAYLFRPYRTEPLYYLVDKLMQEGTYEKAYQITLCALDLPKRNKDSLFQEHWVPDFGIPIQHALCAAYTKRYSESLTMCEKLLILKDLPQEGRERVDECKRYVDQEKIKALPCKLRSLLFPERK